MDIVAGRLVSAGRYAVYRYDGPQSESVLVYDNDELASALDYLAQKHRQYSRQTALYEVFDWLDGSTVTKYFHICGVR